MLHTYGDVMLEKKFSICHCHCAVARLHNCLASCALSRLARSYRATINKKEVINYALFILQISRICVNSLVVDNLLKNALGFSIVIFNFFLQNFFYALFSPLRYVIDNRLTKRRKMSSVDYEF